MKTIEAHIPEPMLKQGQQLVERERIPLEQLLSHPLQGRFLTAYKMAVCFKSAMKKSSLYLETSVVSYLTARPAPDLNTAAHQQITVEWWETKRKNFEIFISKLVMKEAAAGDEEAARRRLKMLKPLRMLPLTREAISLARDFGRVGCMPAAAADDALHLALAVVHGIHFLLTWNCTHINNVATIEEIRGVCESHDYSCPVICTPDELIRI